MNSKNFSKSSRLKPAIAAEALDSLALDVLVHLAGDPEETARFLNESGFQAADLRQAAGQPGFALAMLDYLCSHESLLVAFAAARRIDPSALDAARQHLASLPRDA